jgi:hypothetical protein
MVLLDRSEVPSISGSYLFLFKSFFFTLNFLKMASVWARSSPGFFWSKFLQRGCRALEKLLSGTPFPRRYSDVAPAEFRVRSGPL